MDSKTQDGVPTPQADALADALADASLLELSRLLETRALSAEELTRHCLQRIQALASLNAFVTVDESLALAQAQEADRARARGEHQPLLGIPVAIKDNMCVRSLRMTCGSQMLREYVAPYDATCIARLKEAGAVILGKTNLDEFAMGSSNEHSIFGPCLNPWSTDRIPGGSSGGSAVAVSAGLAAGALGSDTGGSIRQPAAMTGIVGLKPTWGRVSRYGLTAFGSSLDQIGPFARDVGSAAILLQAIAGGDPHDATSVQSGEPHGDVPDFSAELEAGVDGLRIGIPKEIAWEGCDAEVRAAFEAALRLYESLGARLVPVSLPLTDQGISVYYILATAEASANLSRFDGVRYGSRREGKTLEDLYVRTRSEGFGEEVQRRIMLGTYVLSAGYYDAYYGRAIRVRNALKADYRRAFEQCDVIMTPTAPTPAFRLGEKDDPLSMYLADVFTVSANLVGIPGLSLPCGFTQPQAERPALPIGLQLLGSHFHEGLLLRVARAYERETGWHRRRPPIQTASSAKEAHVHV